jgi:hypothetical protein
MNIISVLAAGAAVFIAMPATAAIIDFEDSSQSTLEGLPSTWSMKASPSAIHSLTILRRTTMMAAVRATARVVT